MKLGGTSNFDHLQITGTTTLGGTLAVTLINSFVPTAGQSFDLFDYSATTTGAFSTFTLPTLPNGLRWNTNLLGSAENGNLSVLPAAETDLWTTAAAGSFNDFHKWNSLAVPSSPDTAQFSNASTSPYTVSFSTNATSTPPFWCKATM